VDPVDMQPVNGREPPVLIAIAAWIGIVRLIDNLFVPA
jgi:pantothenate synthetase